MSGFFTNEYPYTDFHELNLSWIIATINLLKKTMEEFVNMNVITFADPIEFDITQQYAKSVIVVGSNGNAYMAKQPVPAGIPLDNTDYWLLIFNFEAYTERANKNFTNNYFKNVERSDRNLPTGTWIILDDVLYKCISDIVAFEPFVVDENIIHFTVEEFLNDFIAEVQQILSDYSATIQQYKDDIDASEVAYRNQLAGDVATLTANLQAQLNTAISGVTVDSEVINARIGYDSTTYSTLGDAIRTQIGDITKGDTIVHDDYINQSVSSAGLFNDNTKWCRTDFISIDDIISIVKPLNTQLRIAFYTSNSTNSWLSNTNYSYNLSSTITKADLLGIAPTAKYFVCGIQKLVGGSTVDFTPLDIAGMGFKINLYTGHIVARCKSQYIGLKNVMLTADATFTIPMGTEKHKNMIIKCDAMYSGTDAPTLSVARRWQNYLGSWNEYYGTPEYHIGEGGKYASHEWRVAPWLEGYADYVTVYIKVPAGTTLYIKSLANVYDDTVSREGCGINLNAHGYSGAGVPAQTLYQYEMAARMGFKYCITVPKVTSDGVYVCLHDDNSIQNTARNDDGTTIDPMYQNRPVSDFTYDQLLQFDFGIVRGLPFKGSRIPRLDAFFKICSKTGMHPMLSVHPSLSGHWNNIKAMAKKYGVLDKLNIKAPTANIEAPMSVLGNEIESYTIDDSVGTSLISLFDSLTSTYNLGNVKRVIEYNYNVLSDDLIAEVLNNGYACGVYNITADATHTRFDRQLELIEKGVTEFTEDYNGSVGLNW